MPDYESRLSILRSVLRKTPVSKDVDLQYLASQTEKFTGADLTEICQRAAKLAVREDIMRSVERDKIREEAEREGVVMDTDVDDEDQVPEILPAHFEEAVRNARRSVSDRDLAQYSSFAQTLQQSRAQLNSGGTSLSTFQFPAAQAAAQGGGNGNDAADDEDDLYA